MPLEVLVPREWTSDNRVIFPADVGDSRNIWQVAISPSSFAAVDTPRRLTSGAGPEDLPSTSDGSRIAYCNVSTNIDIWSLPLDHQRGTAGGELRRLTESSSLDIQPAISGDGRRLVFASNRAGNYDIWAKDLETGAERALTISPAFESKPAITADGSKVAFNDWASGKPKLNVAQLAGTAGDGITTVCHDDCFLPWDWSPDNRYLLYWSMDRKQVGVLDVASGNKAIVLKHAQYSVLRPTLSPDGRWVAFDVSVGRDRVQVFIAPFHGMSAPSPDTWSAITKGDTTDNAPRWSPDNNSLYFLSNREGFRCFWRQRLDPKTKRPLGEPHDVYHMHGARRSLSSVPFHQLDISVASDKLVFPMNERVGNIWMAEWKR